MVACAPRHCARAVLEVRSGRRGRRRTRRPVRVLGLAYFFTDQIEAIVVDVHGVERWLGLAALLVPGAVLVGVWRWNRRVVKEPLDEEGIAEHSPRP